MQTRILATVVGCLLGVVFAPTINGTIGLSPVVAFIGCAVGGAVLGWVASLFIDVFKSSAVQDRSD